MKRGEEGVRETSWDIGQRPRRALGLPDCVHPRTWVSTEVAGGLPNFKRKAQEGGGLIYAFFRGRWF